MMSRQLKFVLLSGFGLLVSLATLQAASRRLSAPADGRTYDLSGKILAPTKVIPNSKITVTGKLMRDPLRGPVKLIPSQPKVKQPQPRKFAAGRMSFKHVEISGMVQVPRLVFENEELDVPFTEQEVSADFLNKTLEDGSRDALINLPTNP